MSRTRNATSARTRADPIEDGIRRRLRQLLDRYSQAELARRTGFSKASVSRCLNGTTISAAFCHAVVNEFGVNPSWLLVGEGVPYLSEVAENTGRFAADLLNVVNALNAVSQMRIGALGGKQHARTLRDLGDAMTRHDQLHRRLNKHSAPILRDVLAELRNVLDEIHVDERNMFDKSSLDGARSLSRTAEQLARFCDDPGLVSEQILLQGRLAILDAAPSTAAKLMRKAIALSFNRNEGWGEHEVAVVVQLVDVLVHTRRYRDARRIGNAALNLASDEARTSVAVTRLRGLLAVMDVTSGNLKRGLATLTEIRTHLHGAPRLEVDANTMSALLWAGMIEMDAAVAFGEDHMLKSVYLLSFATLLDREAELEQAIRCWDRHPGLPSWVPSYAGLLLSAQRGEDDGLYDKCGELIAASPSPANFDSDPYYDEYQAAICGTQLYLVAGHMADARKHYRRSQKVIAALPDGYFLTVLWQARHHRNALSLGTKAQKAEAREFFRRHIELGYRCFDQLAT